MAIEKNFVPLSDEPLMDGTKGTFVMKTWMERTTDTQNKIINEQANQAQLIQDLYG